MGVNAEYVAAVGFAGRPSVPHAMAVDEYGIYPVYRSDQEKVPEIIQGIELGFTDGCEQMPIDSPEYHNA